jgi:RNA polymerase sigma-70 factor (ECF subfamily)
VDTPRVERFEEMYAATAGRVLAYALRRADRETALEVVSETYLVAWRRFDRVPEDALPWLLGVARKVLSNTRRSDARRSALDERLRARSFGASTAGSDTGDEVAGRLVVLTALDRLSPAEREAVTLWAWDGLDGRRAAEVLGCSRTAFALRLHRARRRLEKELDAAGHLFDDEAVAMRERRR